MTQALWDLVKPDLVLILGAITAGLLAYIRAWFQKHVAVAATESVEREALETPMSSLDKKALAMARTSEKLPAGVHPLTNDGLDRLVESAVSEGVKRASVPPQKA